MIVNGNKIIIGLSSKPEKGKANLELIKKISKKFNVSSSQVKIIAGAKSKNKVIEIVKNRRA
ncbi:MAG: DUF167 domain-containing protein [Candidatus Bathyarchaeota archaeon]|nr:DUF167 domain-containing protein [Candidatus Bathyarchaeota archaeon]